MDRAAFAAVLAADGSLSAWTHYAEPPEQLAKGAAMVVAPRSPYVSWSTYSTPHWTLTVHLLVPRTHGSAMDLIDAGLVALRAVITGLPDAGIDDVASVGILDEVGAVSYVVASLGVTVE